MEFGGVFFPMNLIGVSLLLAMIDAGNTCKAVIMDQKKVQLVWDVNLKKCLYCPHAVCVAGTVCIRENVCQPEST